MTSSRLPPIITLQAFGIGEPEQGNVFQTPDFLSTYVTLGKVTLVITFSLLTSVPSSSARLILPLSRNFSEVHMRKDLLNSCIPSAPCRSMITSWCLQVMEGLGRGEGQSLKDVEFAFGETLGEISGLRVPQHTALHRFPAVSHQHFTRATLMPASSIFFTFGPK